MRVTQIIAAAVLAAALSLTPSLGSAQQTVRVGQGVPTLSFLPVWASRALNTFAPQGLTISAALMPGGDASALAALDAGDVDLAAVGSETALRAAAKGQPFEISYSLMSKVTLQLVASTSFLESKGVKPGDPLDKRLAALKGAVIGVSGIGGAQEAAARWVAAKGGLIESRHQGRTGRQPRRSPGGAGKLADRRVRPVAAGKATRPRGEGGCVLVSLGDDFPLLAKQPFLVLVREEADRWRSVRALFFAPPEPCRCGAAVVAKPEETALAIQKQFFVEPTPMP